MGKPRIGMVGYYGYGNYGDELFLEVFGKYLSDFEFVFLQDQLERPFFTKPLDKKVETLDAILIGGGDIVIPNYWSDQYFEDVFLRKPVYGCSDLGRRRPECGQPACQVLQARKCPLDPCSGFRKQGVDSA
jgi:hypothetical protein